MKTLDLMQQVQHCILQLTQDIFLHRPNLIFAFHFPCHHNPILILVSTVKDMTADDKP